MEAKTNSVATLERMFLFDIKRSLGRMYNRVQEYKEALSHVQAATLYLMDIRKKFIEELNQMMQMKLSPYELKGFKQTLRELDIDMADTLHTLGTTFQGLKMNDDAVRCYELCLESRRQTYGPRGSHLIGETLNSLGCLLSEMEEGEKVGLCGLLVDG